MKISVYQKPANFEVLQHSIPKGAQITVTDAKTRVYFHVDLVEQFKMLSYPPTFAITNEGEWAICFMLQSDHSFPLKEYRGTFYFHFSDIVYRILKDFNKKKVYFTLKETSLPHVFLLDEFDTESYQKEKSRQYKKNREFLVENQPQAASYYDMLVNGEFTKA